MSERHFIKGTKTISEEVEITDDQMYDLVIKFLHKEFDIPFDYVMEDGKVYRVEEHGGHTTWFVNVEHRDMEVIDSMVQSVLSELKYNRVEKRK